MRITHAGARGKAFTFLVSMLDKKCGLLVDRYVLADPLPDLKRALQWRLLLSLDAGPTSPLCLCDRFPRLSA
jgi:hypothetical protein